MAAASDKWYNLSEMARLTGINRAQLHKYVKTAPTRFTTKKLGKRTVFAESSVRVFEAMRAEGLRKVGKKVTPRKKATESVRRKPGRPKASAAKKAVKTKAKAKPAAAKAKKAPAKRVAKKKVAAKKAPAKRVAKKKVAAKKAPAKRVTKRTSGKLKVSATPAQMVAMINKLQAAVADLKKSSERPLVITVKPK